MEFARFLSDDLVFNIILTIFFGGVIAICGFIVLGIRLLRKKKNTKEIEAIVEDISKFHTQDYILLQALDRLDMQLKIQDHLDKGYELTGGMVVTVRRDGILNYNQSMIRDLPKEVQSERLISHSKRFS